MYFPNRPKTWITAEERLKMLASYAAASLRLVPLNYLLKNGKCSCGKDCGAPGKHPIYRGWQQPENQITDVEKLRKTLRKHPLCNWGAPTGEASGYFVLDIDAKSDGYSNVKKLEEEHGQLPSTLTATTGGGGKHYFFKWPAGRRVRNSAGDIAPGIDVRGDRGQVAISPSKHKSGNRYKFDNEPGTIEIAEAPAWLLDLVCKEDKELQPSALTPEQIESFKQQHRQFGVLSSSARRYVEAALDKEVENVLSAAEGRRNKTLNSAAFNLGRYVASGFLGEHDVYAALLGAADAIGLERSSSDATIKSGLAGGQKRPKTPPDPDNYRRKPAATSGPESAEPVVFQMSEAEVAAFDRKFGEALDRELELQKLPNYKELCEEEARRQREEQERIDAGNRQRTPEPEPHPPMPLDPIKWHRCHECDPETAHRHCPKCATEKLGVTRPRPVDSPCTRGGRYLVQSTEKGKEGRLAKFQPKCGMWGCYKCGYDNECDHLAHYMLIAQDMNDSYETPVIHLPDYHIENPKTARVDIQNGVWKATVHEDHRRKYANKLSKMGVYYIIDYAGNDKYSVYCFLPVGMIDESRLNYSSKSVEIIAEKITFRQFDAEHRTHLSNAGRFIKLQKSLWDLCDKPFGARKRHNAVTYCKALRMPRRMVSTGKNRLVGAIMLNEEEILKVCDEMGAETYRGDTRKIDLSHRRGLTQYLIEFIRYDLKDACNETIKRFIDRLTGKDKVVEPAYDAYEYAAGSSCLQYPLVT